MGVGSLSREDPLEEEIPVFLPETFHGQRTLAGYNPKGHKQLDTTEQENTKKLNSVTVQMVSCNIYV